MKARIEGLDSLRGIAALIVVIHHFSLIIVPEYMGGLYDLLVRFSPFQHLVNGRMPVILFFVLSGFVLGRPYFTDRALPYKTFIIRRFCRIYIPYMFAVSVAAFLWAVLAAGRTDVQFQWNFWDSPINFGTLLSYVFMTGTDNLNTLNPIIWTLIFEMRIALIFPFLMMLMRRASIVTVIVSVVAGYMAARMYSHVEPDSNLLYAKTLAGTLLLTCVYIPFFMFGAFVAAHLERIKFWFLKIPVSLHLCAAALIFLMPGVLFFDRYTLADMWYAMVSCYLIAGCAIYARLNTLLMARPLLWLGKVSFSLYLMHTPVIYTMVYLFHGLLPVSASVVLSFPLILIVAHLTHIYVEQPSMALGKKWGWTKLSTPIPA